MSHTRTLRQTVIALAILVAFLFQGTWALAGTTGGLGGVVNDEAGKPVAGAAVKVTSASQIASTTTDASGHFAFLDLAPDTYTIAIVKDKYAPASIAGIVVFADQSQSLQFVLHSALKEIAKVTSTAAGNLVKAGVGSDIYNVSSSAIQASTALGGGGNLNTAYSAISSVPGVTVTIGGMGWNQNVFIRGAQSFFTGYEYDGVPVNRAFDNYNASTESNLGLQELQVYTGGGPASNSSAGTSGFINQVIKTGTFPGFAQLSGGVASSAFYHQASVEAGGATPDRDFSYYVGLSGYDQAFRLIDNDNGASLMGAGGIYSDYSYANAGISDFTAISGAAYPQCSLTDGSTPAGALAAVNTPGTYNPTTKTTIVNPLLYVAPTPTNPGNPNGKWGSWCLNSYTGLAADTSAISDRENIINLHFAIPRKNGQRDDIQLLWNASLLKTATYGDVNDLGGPNQFALAQTGHVYCAPTQQPNSNPLCGTGSNYAPNYPSYMDGYVFNLGFGAPVVGANPELYGFPDSPTNRAVNAELPYGAEDGIYNDQGIVKIQYTHPFSDRAYARAFAYTFFSDWNMTGPYSAFANYIYGAPDECCDMNYLLNTHNVGAELQFADQINDKNLLSLTANDTSARVLRDNNTTALEAWADAGSPFGIISGNHQGNFVCWDDSNGDITGTPNSQVPCFEAPLGHAGDVQGAGGPSAYTYPTVGGAAAAAGAQLVNLWSGPEYAAYNTVDPNFANVSLSDQWRPSDRWLVNAAVRYEDYDYKLADSTTEADQFYAQIAADNFCYNTTPGQQGVYSAPLNPGQPPPASPIEIAESSDCNTYIQNNFTHVPESGYVHPNGTMQDGIQAPSFTANSPSSYGLAYWSARYSATYNESPDTIWRFSGGRFTEPPISASVDYLNNSGNNTKQWANFMDLGFFTPFHNTPAMTSAQYDISLERHIRGTDMSFKLSPFSNFTNGYQEQSFIGPGYVTQVPVGQFKSYGVEGAFTKGDFARDGFSGTVALTYTKAQVRFQSGLVNNLGANQIGYYNTAIQSYNALAKGGNQNYPCFEYNATTGANGTPIGSPGVPQACGNPGPGIVEIANPYFNSRAQGLLDPNGWYAPASDVALPGVNTDLGLYNSPWVTSIVLNYRHQRFAVTPSLQIATGSSYGSPFTVLGVDPRECTAVDPNQMGNQCAYTSLLSQGATSTGLLYIPNPQTGSFDGIGQYHNPNIMVGNIAFTYQASPKISVNLTVANVFHTCFGGSSEPWTAAYPPSSNVCGYGANGFYVSNFQLGPGYLTPGVPSSYNAAANGNTKLYPWQLQPYAPNTGSAAGVIPPPFNAYLTINVKV